MTVNQILRGVTIAHFSEVVKEDVIPEDMVSECSKRRQELVG